MTTLGLVGCGQVGAALARLAVDAGHDVVVSNKCHGSTLHALVAQLGVRARAGTPEDSATAGDLVIVAIPYRAYPQLQELPLHGRVVVDAGNYRPVRDGQIPRLDARTTTSSELLQLELPGSALVKAFNNIHAELLSVLARPRGSPERSALAIAGDDQSAKDLVTHLIDSIGYDVFDAGPLAEGWRYEPGQPAHGIYRLPKADSPPGGAVVTVATLMASLASAAKVSSQGL